jgi:uncharacterized protein
MALTEYIKDKSFYVIVKPNSKKTEFLCYDENKKALRIALHAAPEKGEANVELVKFLKKELKCSIKIISGFTSKLKLVKIE